MPATHIFLFTPMIFLPIPSQSPLPTSFICFFTNLQQMPITHIFIPFSAIYGGCLPHPNHPNTTLPTHIYPPGVAPPSMHLVGSWPSWLYQQPPRFAVAQAQLPCPSLNSRVISLVHWTHLQWVKTMFHLSVSNGIIRLTYVISQSDVDGFVSCFFVLESTQKSLSNGTYFVRKLVSMWLVGL